MKLITNIKKSIRKQNLIEDLENIVTTDKEAAEYINNKLTEGHWTQYQKFGETDMDIMADCVDFNLRDSAMSYVWSVAISIIDAYGIKSEEFKYTAKKILSRREKKLMKNNIRKLGTSNFGENARWGIARVENRNYDIKEIVSLYKEAKEVYNELIKGKDVADWRFLYKDGCDECVELNPVYKYYNKK